MVENTKPKTTKKTAKFDYKWLWVGLAIIVLIGLSLAVGLRNNIIDSEKIASSLSTDNGDQKINWERYPTFEIELSESTTLTKGGTYHLTGTLENGSITIDAKNTVVRLILDNVTIKSDDGPAISCLDCDDLVIELLGQNYIEDSSSYSSGETDTGAIISKGDLTFNGGTGSLEVKSNYMDAIVGKDDLKFNGGTYIIDASDDGIRGTDSVYITGGSFTIASKTDAIKSTNELDAGKGFVLIEAGDFDIKSGAKGIKATNSILIQGGTYNIDAYDDAVHSNNYIGLVNGELTINAGDDGIHADKELIIDGGEIDILKSYEGLEAQAITINGGNIKVIASDDGFNAGGGTDNSNTTNNRNLGRDNFAADTNCVLTINGGNIYVNASGDGLDSNGYLYFNGGNVYVDGPTNSGNGALDSGTGIVMQGGNVVAVGASGMASSLGDKSGVPNISVYFASMQPAGTTITVKDSSGKVVLTHESAKTFSHLAAGSENLILGETYTIYVDDVMFQQFTISSVTTVIGNSGANQYNMPGRGPRV